LLSVGAHAGLYRERVLEQSGRLRVLIEDVPGFGSRVSYSDH
jgi:hypothetical protein